MRKNAPHGFVDCRLAILFLLSEVRAILIKKTAHHLHVDAGIERGRAASSSFAATP